MQQDFQFRHLGLVQLKGKQELVSIHECFSANPSNDVENKLATLTTFNEGMSFYLNKSFEKANEAFEKVVAYNPDDHTASFFYNKTRQIVNTDNYENHAGIVKMSDK